MARTSKAPDLNADRARALALTPVSRETAIRLDRLVALLLRWQSKTNLIAPSTIPELWTRHVADSLQLLAPVPDARIWLDLGSGAGFPGLVLACALADQPGSMVHLVESNAKKAAFLREAIRVTRAPAMVEPVRIEDFARNQELKVDVVTARALAPLDRLLQLAYPWIERGAQGLFLKGQDVEAELTKASKYWTIAASLVASKTSLDSRIVVVRSLERRHVQRGRPLRHVRARKLRHVRHND
jgi:16S rRNA (guanine527-N7)-methyltransferase